MTPEALRKSPADARLLAEVVADRAGDYGLPRKKSYRVARDLDPADLLECYHTRDRAEFLGLFGGHYNRLMGDSPAGPLFD